MKGEKQRDPAAPPQGDQAKSKTSPSNNSTPASDNAKSDRAGTEFKLADPEPWDEPVDGAELLDKFMMVFRRYLALPDGAAEALALWVLFTHTFDAWTVSPRLALTSPTLRCGKTTALSILGCLVPRALLASNVTPAVVFRVIERDRPTLLMDEADTFLDQSSDFKGILNSGHTRATAYVWRCDGDNYDPRGFSTWAPIAIAKIGKLSATLHDRSIVVGMRRRRPDEDVKRFRSNRTADLRNLAKMAARWAKDNIDIRRDADPEVPNVLHDRASDNWRPLFAIADRAGGSWPERARSAALRLSSSGAAEDASVGVQLLGDIRTAFEKRKTDRLSSNNLCGQLHKMVDRPWVDWKRGWPINFRQVADLLKPFGIQSKDLRFDDKTLKGYERAKFEDAFARYLPSQSATPQHSNASSGLDENPSATRKADVADQSGGNPLMEKECCVVADRKGDRGEGNDDMTDMEVALSRPRSEVPELGDSDDRELGDL